ncbi:MAG: hypothetical protein ACREEM_02665 [Blastocatellia bacterium]
MITQAELETKWPREQFEQWNREGKISASGSYEEYLEMRWSQVELARLQKIELYGEDLDEVPYEEPPDLTPEDEASLLEAWRYVAAKMAAEKDAAEENELMPIARVA